MRTTHYKTLILFFLIGYSITAYSQSTKFQRIIGGSGDDKSYSMAQTKDGGYILTGYTKSFGAGGEDIYLTKTDGLGKVTWSKTYGTSSGNETGWKVRQTSDSGYVVVGTASTKKGDGLFFKTDKDGNLKWQKIFNSDSAEDVYNVIESRINGAFYVTGYLQTDSFGTDAFLAKYSTSGNLVWQRLIGASKNEEGYSLVEDLNGNIAVVGVVVDDTVTVGGKNGSSGDEDIFVARFDPSGNNLWLRNFGTTADDQGWDIKYLKGEYIITGWSYSGSVGGDLLIAVVDTSGNFSTAYTVNGSGSSRAFSLVIDPDETYSVTGYINTVTNGRESFYLNTNKNGNVNTFRTIGGSSTDGHWPSEIARTIDGGYTIFTSSNSFKSSSSYDLYMIRMDNKGVVDCNQTFGIVTSKTVTMQSGRFGTIRYASAYDNISLTTNTVTGNKDSVLCCKLQAQVANSTLRICKGENIRLGKPSIPGYVYKWTAVGSSYTSSEASPLVSPTASTRYKLEVTSSDGKCTKDTASVLLSIRADLANKNFVRDTFFCQGDTVQVKAKGGAINYSWAGKKTTLNGQTVSIFQADVIILTITDTTTCMYKDTLTVTMKNLPTFSLGNDTTICDNTRIILSGPANMKSYSWNGGQATTRTFTTSEEKTHTLLVSDNFGCKYSDSKVIFNNPAGGPFSLGPDTVICKGINYTIFGWSALTNYLWNGVSSFNPNKVVNDAGTFTYQAQNGFGCIHRDTIVIKLKPDPTFSLGSDGGVCVSGRKLKGPAGMTSYLWSDNSTGQNLDVFFAGNYWLKVTGTNGCVFTDDINLVVVQNPKPELGNDTTIYDCDSIYLDAGNYVSFKWLPNNETTRIIKVKKANLYSVTVTDINTCSGEDFKSVKTTKCPNSINLIKIPGLKVQPNPARTKLNIEWLANSNGASLILFDIHGKKVFEQEAMPGLGQYSIDVSQWSRGIYYLKVTTETASQSIKVILE
ncbi:MAG: T9SS type A sorting domain-containing protein [Bacteroidia bacterium]